MKSIIGYIQFRTLAKSLMKKTLVAKTSRDAFVGTDGCLFSTELSRPWERFFSVEDLDSRVFESSLYFLLPTLILSRHLGISKTYKVRTRMVAFHA
jgi:hypothetical protein